MYVQWRNQGLPGWASRPPGRPKWGRKWRKFEEKWEKLQEIDERMRKCPILPTPEWAAGYGPVYVFRAWWIFTSFIFGYGESPPNNIWRMVNLEWTYVLLSYYFVYLKVNLHLEKTNQHSGIFTQLYFRDGESWPTCFGKEVNWWWMFTQRFCWKGEQRWRLEVGRFKMSFDACIIMINKSTDLQSSMTFKGHARITCSTINMCAISLTEFSHSWLVLKTA